MANLSKTGNYSIVPIKKSSAIVKSDKFFNDFTQQKKLKVSQKTTRVDPCKVLKRIEKKVTKIDKILKNSLLFQKKESEKKRKQDVDKSFAEKEKDLEKKKPKQEKGIKLPSPPGLGLFDTIRNYIGNIIVGFFAVRLIDFLPTLLNAVPTIVAAGEFIIDLGGKLLDGLITFVDWGYKAIDGTRQFIKNIGGEGLAQNFDKITGAIDNLIEIALITALATADSGGDGGEMGTTGIRGAAGQAGRSRYGTSAAAARRYAERYGIDAARKKFGSEAVKSLGGRYARSGVTNLARKGLVGVIGKGGAKAALKVIKPILGKLPVIGGLLEFAISWATGDPVGKAAFRGIGAGLVGAVGTAIGGPIGLAIGGFVGGEIGGALYDVFFGGKKPKQSQVKGIKAAGGGQASTRGGKTVAGPAKRGIKKETTRIISVIPQEVKPGASVGGEKSIKKIFPGTTKAGVVSPLGYLKSSSDRFSEAFGFGGLFSLITKAQLGQESTKVDYQNAAQGLMSWMQTAFSSKILRTGGAFAEGGEVDASMFSYDENMKNAVAKSIEDSVAPKIEGTIKDLTKQLMFKDEKIEEKSPEQDPNLTTQEGVSVTGGNADFWALVAIASLESGNPQGRADVAQSVYNRLASGVYGGKTIKELILRQNQYQPVGESNTALWHAISDKQSAIAAVASHRNGGSRAAKMIEETAAAIQNQALQKSAAEFVGGRTDFWAESLTPPSNGIGYVNRNGHRFGWFVGPAAIAYGRKNPGPAKAPSLGDIIVMGGGAGGPLGTGSVSSVDQFTPIAKQFGLTLTSSYRPGDPGYHGKNRARDYSNDGVGSGTPQQLAFAKHLAQKYGSSLSQLIYTPLGYGIANKQKVDLDYWGSSTNSQHYHHVHVAYAKGGETLGYPHLAMLGEEGTETVIDADSSIPEARDLFLAINQAKGYKGVMKAIQQYAPYDTMSPETIIINNDNQGMQDVSSEPQPILMGGGSVNSDMQFEDSLMYG